ncbi:MAG: hypothetical protein LUF92_11190 [Clostridiales bacterium]|nr:hypothetical protein [Clostridiales bacterium]
MIAIMISAISLVVSLVSVVFSLKSQHLQDKVNEMDLKLKEYELAQKEKETQLIACVEARAISVGSKSHRIKVWNSGNASAYNVTVAIEESAQIMVLDQDKMPFEILEPNKNFELILCTHLGSANKFKIMTKWEDKDGQKHSKVQITDM